MHRIQECRPDSGHDIATQDSELIVHAVLCRLSDDKSCKTLVAALLGDATKLASITNLRDTANIETFTTGKTDGFMLVPVTTLMP